MQSSRRTVSVTLSLPCSTRLCAVLTRPESALVWRTSSLRLAQKVTPSPSRTFLSSLFRRAGAEGVKGERKIFYHLLVVLYERYAAVVVDLVQLIPTYGCWKDLLNFLLECKHGNVDYAPLRHKVWNMFALQLKADEEELAAATRQGRSPKLTARFKICTLPRRSAQSSPQSGQGNL